MPTSAINLKLSPPTTYLKIAPGQKKTHTVIIEQTGTMPLEVTPTLVDFKTDGITGQPVLSDHSDFTYLSISFPDEEANATNTFQLKPGQRKAVGLKFSIPENATVGEYPLTVLFRAQPLGAVAEGNSQTGAIIGSNIVLLITDSTTDQSSLAVERIRSPWIVDSILGNLSFSVIAENTGANAGVASGSAVIKDWQNSVVAEFPVHPDMVLAQTSRQLRTAPLPESPNSDIDPTTVTNQFAYNPAFLIGPYTIEVSLTTGQGDAQNVSVSSKKALAVPYSILALILLVMLVVAAYESKALRKAVQKLLNSHT
jgi:hypothetical protein